MKSILLRAGLLTCLILLGYPHKGASAEVTWPTKCVSYGEIKPNQNPSFQHLNCLLTSAALEAKIPPEVVKAVATKESDWRQFDNNGQPIVSQDGGIGLMQITNQIGYDEQKLKDDINYNIQAGIEVLNSMYQRTDLPKIKDARPEVIENWYFSVMAYNGTKPVNSPLFQSDGTRNVNAYQEQVFASIEGDGDRPSFQSNAKLGRYPFETTDFEYDPTSDENIEFKKMEYILTDWLHTSTYLFQTGDQVVVTGDDVNLRSTPSTDSSSVKQLAKNTRLIIQGNFSYDQSLDRANQFVWYPVKTADQGLVGYISSAYIMKVGKVTKVNVVTDKVSPQNIGTPVIISATSEGSSNPEYRFFVRDGNGILITLQGYEANNATTWTPTKSGVYTIIVHAKDKSSGVSYESRTEVQYQVVAGKVTGVSVGTDKPSPQDIGMPIKITATSQGSSEPEYRFFVRDEEGVLTTLQGYGANNVTTWTPTKSGVYTIIVHAKDKNSGVSYESRTEMQYQVAAGKVTGVSVGTDKSSPQDIGTPIKITATSQGSSEPEYRFFVRDEKGVLTVLQGYGANNATTWIPTKSGVYTIIVHARDKNSGSNYESRMEMGYQVKLGKVTSVGMSTDKVSPQTIGTPITLTATSQGSSEPEYRFFVRDEKGILTTLQGYGASNATTWTPTKSGSYTIIVHAKDKNSGVSYESRAETYYRIQ